MNKIIITSIAICLFALPALAAPALGDKPPRWEFCEVQVTRTAMARPAPLGGAGGVLQPVAIDMTYRFITGEEEITAKTWEELADKMKAPAPKKEGTENVHRLRVFNRLGAEGWEPTEHAGPAGSNAAGAWIFKRRVQ